MKRTNLIPRSLFSVTTYKSYNFILILRFFWTTLMHIACITLSNYTLNIHIAAAH